MKIRSCSGKSGRRAIRAAAVLGTLAASAACTFASAADSGWYGGANIGKSKATIDDPRIIGGLAARGFATTKIDDDDRDTAFKIFGGYQFNRYLAIEGSYFRLGRFAYSAVTVPTGTLDGSTKMKGVDLDAVGVLPIAGKLSAFGRLGVNYVQAKDSFSSTGLVNVTNPNPSKSATDYKYGFGLQYDLTDRLAARLEAERHRVDDAIGNKGDIDVFSVGLVYRFGAKAQTPMARSAPPEPVAAYTPPTPPTAAPLPAPAPPVTPPPPASRRVTLSADSLFEFGKAVMTPEGKEALDKFSADLRGTTFDSIKVTGYTDRIGGHAYNLKLSLRRAEAVKAYLVGAAGIAAGKIATIGADGAAPVTKPDECKGSKATRKLVACLQPDRRVEVEVSGTR